MSNINKKLIIEWPKSFFSIQDIQSAHPDAVNITLRFRINRAVEEGELEQIGKTPKSVGRPTVVYSTTPVTKKVLLEAIKAGVTLHEEYESEVVDVIKVDGTKDTTTQTSKQTTTV